MTNVPMTYSDRWDEFADSLAKGVRANAVPAPRYPAQPEPASRLDPDGRVSLSRRKLSIEWNGK
jgi:hypothetical protein